MEKESKNEGFKCKQCGKCCLATDHADICDEDIELWRSVGRYDLITQEMLVEWDYFGASWLFRNQSSMRCPFLRKMRKGNTYYCKIQDIKPIFCRSFPKDKKHAKEFCNCPGYERQ
jgi:Fe-S-cluster containining protein